MTTGAQKLLYT